MKATKIFMMAALALTFAACSNDDNDIAQQPDNNEITITATVSSDDATTRALSIDGSNIASTWEADDQFAILYNDGTSNVKRVATVSSINGSTVTITFTIPSSLANNTACKIVYPASAANAANTGADVAKELATQDGTIGNCPEVRVGTATIDKDNHNLAGVTKLVAQNAIFKFTTKNADGSAPINVKPLTVTIGAQNYVITPALATSELYVALPAVSDQAVRFSATGSDSKTYTCSKASVTFAAGKYYQSMLKMAPPITVTWNNDDITGSGNSFSKDGVTITAGSIDFDEKSFEENGTFTTTLGNFTKIEVVVTDGFCDVSGTGWSGDSDKRTWTGNASSVSYNGSIRGSGDIKFVFTIEPKKAAYEHSITIAVDPSTTGHIATAPAMTIEFNTGETWADVAARYDWLDTYDIYTVFYKDKDNILNGNVYDANGGVTPDKTIDPNGSYHWGPQ